MASDSLNEVETQVIISIRDLNDLPPVFNETSYRATIFEESIHLVNPILRVSFQSKFFFPSSQWLKISLKSLILQF